MVAETMHPACMCAGGGRGGERGGRAFYYTGVVPDFSVIQFNVAANLCLSLNFVTVSETPSTDRLSFFKRCGITSFGPGLEFENSAKNTKHRDPIPSFNRPVVPRDGRGRRLGTQCEGKGPGWMCSLPRVVLIAGGTRRSKRRAPHRASRATWHYPALTLAPTCGASRAS